MHRLLSIPGPTSVATPARGPWDTLRALEARMLLLRQMAALAERSDPGEAARCRRGADDAEATLDPLRELVSRGRPAARQGEAPSDAPTRRRPASVAAAAAHDGFTMDVSFAVVFLLAWLAISVVVSLLWGLIARTMENDRATGDREAVDRPGVDRGERRLCAEHSPRPRIGAA